MSKPKAPFMSFQRNVFYVRPAIFDVPSEPEPEPEPTLHIEPKIINTNTIRDMGIDWHKATWEYKGRFVTVTNYCDDEQYPAAPYRVEIVGKTRSFKTKDEQIAGEGEIVNGHFGIETAASPVTLFNTADLDDLIKSPRKTAKTSTRNTDFESAKKLFDQKLRSAKGSGKPASKTQLAHCFKVLGHMKWANFEKADLVDFCKALTHSEPDGLSTHDIWAFNELIRDPLVMSWVAGTLREYRS